MAGSLGRRRLRLWRPPCEGPILLFPCPFCAAAGIGGAGGLAYRLSFRRLEPASGGDRVHDRFPVAGRRGQSFIGGSCFYHICGAVSGFQKVHGHRGSGAFYRCRLLAFATDGSPFYLVFRSRGAGKAYGFNARWIRVRRFCSRAVLASSGFTGQHMLISPPAAAESRAKSQ